MAGARRRCRLAWAAALAMAVACGRSGDDSKAGHTSPPPVAAPAPDPATTLPSCALVPPAEVGAALGIEQVQVPEAEIRASVTTCTYGGAGTAARVTLRFEIGAGPAALTAARAELERAGQRVVDVSGLGDGALAATAADGRRTLTFVVGAVLVAIGSTDPLAHQKKLAARVVERLAR